MTQNNPVLRTVSILHSKNKVYSKAYKRAA